MWNRLIKWFCKTPPTPGVNPSKEEGVDIMTPSDQMLELELRAAQSNTDLESRWESEVSLNLLQL